MPELPKSRQLFRLEEVFGDSEPDFCIPELRQSSTGQLQRIGKLTATVRAERQQSPPRNKKDPWMSSRVEGIQLATFLPIIQHAEQASVDRYKGVFEGNRHRVYSLSFYMTGNEITAEDVMSSTFCRAFATSSKPDAETIDRALVTELRELTPIGNLTVQCQPAKQVSQVRRNTRRADLENAVVQLPATERLIFLMHDVESYDHVRIARTIGITEAESKSGLFQARLKLREILAS
jgi:RNA polymerase sigma-70 factor, ECF subfamily